MTTTTPQHIGGWLLGPLAWLLGKLRLSGPQLPI